MLNTLFIANIRIDLPEYGQPGIIKGRNVETGLPHKGQKSYGF